jgi:pimeloyl-ACP methyl ester carboxylesterase
MEFTSTQQLDNGIVERRFTIPGAGGRPVPTVLWTRASTSGVSPLILMGHGGSGAKDGPGQLDSRDYFTGQLGIATASIDGPVHGERGGLTTTDDPRYREMWHTPGAIDDMNTDWARTLDALLALGQFDAQAVGYIGLSMGTMFGLPFVASEPRIRAAVLGKCGLRGTSIERSGIDRRLAADAPKVVCPVLYHVQWDDTQFLRESAFELYGLIGAADKRLQAIPGPHGGSSPEATDTMRTFLANRLQGRPSDPHSSQDNRTALEAR